MSLLRLIEGIISIARPSDPIGYAAFDSAYTGTDVLFDFGAIRKDIYMEFDQPVTVKLNSSSNTGISLAAGKWWWTGEYASKAYITFSTSTNLRLVANG